MSTQNGWTWNCTGANNPTPVSCSAQKETTIVDPTCSQTYTGSLRVGQTYSFPDYISNNNSFPYTLKNFNVTFKESDDMNTDGTDTYDSFLWYGSWGPGKQIPAGSQNNMLIYAFPKYQLKNPPSKRKQDNISIDYIIDFSDQNGDHSHKECIDYQVTWCGDGVKDTTEGEQCDPADPAKSGW